MTIDTTIPTVNYQSSKPSGPQSTRFAASILKKASTYLNVSLSSPHWQLKDLLSVDNKTNSFKIIHQNKVLNIQVPETYDNEDDMDDVDNLINNNDNNSSHSNSNLTIDNSLDKPLLCNSVKVHSNPRCIKQLDGFTVTGGINNMINANSNPIGLHKGSFTFTDIDNNVQSYQFGEFINNSVSINRSSLNHYVSYLCNNDKHLYSLHITPSGIIPSSTSTYLKAALNHSILSDDGKTLVTLGDSSKIHILHPGSINSSSNGRSMNESDFDIINTNGDCGFSTTFLSNGFQFVSCFQDGLALIYDLRNLSNPIHEIHSTRHKTQPGAFRVCKSTTIANNDDLLCISEHQGRIHLIDTRNFNNHSVLLLPKYLHHSPPIINDEKYNYPITESPNPSNLISYYNQPIIKNIDDFKDIRHFGGELNLGYFESYKYLNSRLSRHMWNDNTQITLQGSYDRQDFIQRVKNNLIPPYISNLVSYNNNSGLKPYQITDDAIIKEVDMWWNKEYKDYSNIWPFGSNLLEDNLPEEIVEIPQRDPFFYVDSDIEINGMEISCNENTNKSQLLIGTMEGVIVWDIDGWKRKCFPCFNYM